MKLRSSISGLAFAVGLGVLVAGCGQVNAVRAQKAFKDANKLYAGSDWKLAAAKYEEAIQLSPENGYSFFFLANCLDNLYRPTRAGEPENDALLTKAIENYKIAAEKIEDPDAGIADAERPGDAPIHKAPGDRLRERLEHGHFQDHFG